MLISKCMGGRLVWSWVLVLCAVFVLQATKERSLWSERCTSAFIYIWIYQQQKPAASQSWNIRCTFRIVSVTWSKRLSYVSSRDVKQTSSFWFDAFFSPVLYHCEVRSEYRSQFLLLHRCSVVKCRGACRSRMRKMWKLSVYFIAGDVSDFRIVLFSFHVRTSGDSLSFQLVIFEFFFFLFLIIHKQNQSINFSSHRLIP